MQNCLSTWERHDVHIELFVYVRALLGPRGKWPRTLTIYTTLGDLFEFLPCVILFLCFSVPLTITSPAQNPYYIYYSRRFVLILALCYFVLVFFSAFNDYLAWGKES